MTGVLIPQVDDKIFCIHGGLSPDLNSMEQIRRILRPTDVPDTGLLCDVLWADPDPNIRGWAESDRGVSFTFGADIVEKFNRKHVRPFHYFCIASSMFNVEASGVA